jgi:hypothetical protein
MAYQTAIDDPLDGLGGDDAAGLVHERFGDQGLHNVRLGVCHSASADATGAHGLDHRKFNRIIDQRKINLERQKL